MTENAVLPPAVTVKLVGCVVMLGGIKTVSVATLLVALPTLLVMMTRYAPASFVVTLVSPSVLLLPPIGVLVLSDQK